MEGLKNHFLEQKIIESGEEFDQKVVKRLDEICRLAFESVKDKLERKFGCFELFGFDFMLDEDLNPHLIEVNTNPALFTDTSVQKAIMPKLVDDSIKLAFELHPEGQKDGEAQVKSFLENDDLSKMALDYRVIFRD